MYTWVVSGKYVHHTIYVHSWLCTVYVHQDKTTVHGGGYMYNTGPTKFTCPNKTRKKIAFLQETGETFNKVSVNTNIHMPN